MNGRACSILIALAALACAQSTPARRVPEMGFLGDYSRLHPGAPGQAEKVYVAPDVDWASYDEILLDPITIWQGTESRSRGLSREQAQALADYFYRLVYDAFGARYTMVTTPGPRTLRFQIALTKLDEKYVVLDVVSTVVPQARALDRLQSIMTGRFAFVGEAAIEAKVSDAESGRLLAEGVDERIGGKRLSSDYVRKWSDVDHIMKYWVERSVHNLCVAQAGQDCPPRPSNRL